MIGLSTPWQQTVYYSPTGISRKESESMILLDEIEPGAEGELTAGRKINRYRNRGASFRKPMAEIEVGDILWDERSSTHWIVRELSYAEADGDDPRGASLYIRDEPRGRMFYENEKHYGSILVLSNPHVLLRYRTEALQREHEVLLESEKPRNAFPIFSTELRAGDTFLHPTRGWLTVESVVQDRKSVASSRSFMLVDGTEVSTEQIGRETKVLREPDRPDTRDSQISDEDFDSLLEKARKNIELASKELEPKAESTAVTPAGRRRLQGSRPFTLGGVAGQVGRIFIDELEKKDTVLWPGAGWQSVIDLVASVPTAFRDRQVRAVTLGNQLRVIPSVETLLVEIFVPDGAAKPIGEKPRELESRGSTGSEAASKDPSGLLSLEKPQSEDSVFVWMPPTAVQDGEWVLTVNGWIEVKRLPTKESTVYYNGNHWDSMGVDGRLHEVREFRTAKGLIRVYAMVRPEDAKLRGTQDDPIYLYDELTSTSVIEGDEARTPAGSWLELKSVEKVEKRVGGIGRLRHVGFNATFSYPHGATAFGPLKSFEDSQGKLAYEVRRRLMDFDIKNLQTGFGA